jgi:hypothetical protein
MNETLPPLPPLRKKTFNVHGSSVEVQAYSSEDMQAYARAAIQALAPVPADVQKVSKRLNELASIMDDCNRLVSTSGDAQSVIRLAAAWIAAPQPAQQVATNPLFAGLIAKHPGLLEELLQQVAQPTIPAPPECKTKAERTAYCFGYFKALETRPQASKPMTEEQISQAWEKSCKADPTGAQQRFVFARELERAHNIKDHHEHHND